MKQSGREIHWLAKTSHADRVAEALDIISAAASAIHASLR